MQKGTLPRVVARTLIGTMGATLLGLVGAPSAAFASQIENTTVEAIGTGPYYDNLCGFKCVLIALASTPTGSSCAMDSGWHFAIDISTAEGRVAAAVVLSAKASGATVQVIGLNTCIFNNRVERYSHFVQR